MIHPLTRHRHRALLTGRPLSATVLQDAYRTSETSASRGEQRLLAFDDKWWKFFVHTLETSPVHQKLQFNLLYI
jgi:hypothetical protein